MYAPKGNRVGESGNLWKKSLVKVVSANLRQRNLLRLVRLKRLKKTLHCPSEPLREVIIMTHWFKVVRWLCGWWKKPYRSCQSVINEWVHRLCQTMAKCRQLVSHLQYESFSRYGGVRTFTFTLQTRFPNLFLFCDIRAVRKYYENWHRWRFSGSNTAMCGGMSKKRATRLYTYIEYKPDIVEKV